VEGRAGKPLRADDHPKKSSDESGRRDAVYFRRGTNVVSYFVPPDPL
jgi:hypothetical protein